jgi:hypothetical protein
VSFLLRDKQLRQKLAMSKSELHRRRKSDPDFPVSFFIGANMRATEESAADLYIEVLKERARKKLPTPGRRPRGRPRRSAATSMSV